MKHHPFPALILAVLILASCGTSMRRTLADEVSNHSTATIDDTEFVLVIDNHRQSRKNADAIFERWARERHLKGNITGKRLMSIAPKDDGCHLTYDFRMTAGNQERVTLIVTHYSQTYRSTDKEAERLSRQIEYEQRREEFYQGKRRRGK